MENKKLTVEERAALFTRLLKISDKLNIPTKQAKEAQKILRSLEVHQPKSTSMSDGSGRAVSIKNPVTKTKGSIVGGEVMFSVDGSIRRPNTPHSKTALLGIRASVNQLINEIPPVKGNWKPWESKYSAHPITDSKDMEKESWFNRESNARSKAYDRYTKGAFKAQKNKKGELVIHGERINETTWQPRGPKGRYAKHVKFDPKDVIRQLGKVAGQRQLIGRIPYVGKPLQALLTADDVVKGVTGISPTQEFMEQAHRTIKDRSIPRAATLMIR